MGEARARNQTGWHEHSAAGSCSTMQTSSQHGGRPWALRRKASRLGVCCYVSSDEAADYAAGSYLVHALFISARGRESLHQQGIAGRCDVMPPPASLV